MEALCFTPKIKNVNTIEKRIESFVKLGQYLNSFDIEHSDKVKRAIAFNPWFTADFISSAFKGISEMFLTKEALTTWIGDYQVPVTTSQKTVGIVMAGNIPCVGFHDLLSVLIVGHRAQVKLSEKDSILMSLLITELQDIDNYFTTAIDLVDRLSGFDAVIATGSDTSSRYFEKYFSFVPHIIRKNRHGVGVIFKDDDKPALQGIAKDIFNYFGLGCRNISKLYLEEGVELSMIFEILEAFSEVRFHNKYKNNFDYNQALFLLNRDEFYSNDFIHLRHEKTISSRIASINYEYFKSKTSLVEELQTNKEAIQCIISNQVFDNINCVPFGKAQSPHLWDYADGVDTIDFLINI